jgi:hypothetical protein
MNSAGLFARENGRSGSAIPRHNFRSKRQRRAYISLAKNAFLHPFFGSRFT